MLLRFKLELDVVLDGAGQAKLIELARRFYADQGGATALNGQGQPCQIPAEEFMAGTEQALMELLERNPLLTEAEVTIEQVSCRPAIAPGEAAEPAGDADHDSSGCGRAEHSGDAEDNLDEFEPGLYLCRWPNGEFSVVKADSRREALVELDEWAGANPAWLSPLESWMVDFRLNDRGEIELADLGEETADLIWDRCYPELDAVLSSDEVLRHRGGERNPEAAEKIRRAVEHERNRLWSAQPDGTPAKTAMGRELQKRLRTVGPVADRYVELAASEILRRKAGEKGKPN